MLDDPKVIQDIIKRLRELNPEPPPKHPYKYKEKFSVYLKQWQKENLDRYKIYKKKYEATEEGRASKTARKHRRRTRMLEAEGSFTAEEWELKKKEFDYRCAYCGKKTKKLTVDHFIPLSKGGTNYIENILPACGQCNQHKWDKDPSQLRFSGRIQLVMAKLRSK